MNYGLYASYLGMRARMRTVEVIANNMANASTTGFKADHLYYGSVESSEFEAARLQQAQADQAADRAAQTIDPATDQFTSAPLPPSLRALGVVTGGLMDFSTGSIRETDRSLDVALSGDGFLVVQTPRGERYTRSGSLTIDSTGQLVTHQGDLVVGDGGPITITPGEVSIGEDGTISSAGQIMGRLKLVRFQEPRSALVKEGDSLFVATGNENPQEATQTLVIQGMLESSNVNSIDEMVSMMRNNREFESLQRSMTSLMSLHKIAAEIGKI